MRRVCMPSPLPQLHWAQRALLLEEQSTCCLSELHGAVLTDRQIYE